MSLLRCATNRALKFHQLLKVPLRMSVTTPPSREPFTIEDHSLHFKVERYWTVGMLPLVPTAYFIHTPAMDAVLTIAVVLHVHWGIAGVVSDYARPFVMGDTLAKMARASVYVITVILLASLLHFNNSDVGLTKAFEMDVVLTFAADNTLKQSHHLQQQIFCTWALFYAVKDLSDCESVV